MRKTYEIGGMQFAMRTFTGRDLVRVTGKLALLPGIVDGGAKAKESSFGRANDIQDHLLALCSRRPKITLDEPDEIPDGTLPVSEIPDAIYNELVAALCSDSGYTAEAAEEVRPTIATASTP